MAQHPLGVQPEHIADLIGDTNDVRTKGLGNLSGISDEAVLNICQLLTARDLAVLQTVSKAFYCFANHDDLWKALVLEEFSGDWVYRNTWQETYIACKNIENHHHHHRRTFHPVSHFYSDLLHQPWLCATLDIDPSWLEVENIDRRSNLSVEEFKKEYDGQNRPVILTDVVSSWPAVRKWNKDYLRTVFQGRTVIVGDVPMSFEAYCSYADAQSDELPLYLFDKEFVKTAPQLAQDYTVPPHFDEDLFSVLGEEARPDYRWLIAGPWKSGSTWHKDPNQTSAWNACIAGSKRWILYPPNALPPGVRASADGADVACPVSVMEWFLSFYHLKDAGGVQPLECTTRAGEVLFVPRGWWHAVLNLSESVAVTQNFVGASNLGKVLEFLNSPHADSLVSGVETAEERATLHDRFVAALREQRPEVMEKLECEREERRQKMEADNKLASCFKLPDREEEQHDNDNVAKTTEKEKVTANSSNGVGFSFQFNFNGT